MPGYVKKALTRFQHPPLAKQQDQPYPHVKPNYGEKKQYSQEDDNALALNKAEKKIIQEVCGVFLFLARAVDGGLLPALSSLASQQEETLQTAVSAPLLISFLCENKKTVLTKKSACE